MGECEVEAANVRDVRDTRVHRDGRSCILPRPLAKTSVGETQHAVAPPMLLGLASNASARHLRNDPALPFPETNVRRPVNEGTGVGKIKILADKSSPSLLVEP